MISTANCSINIIFINSNTNSNVVGLRWHIHKLLPLIINLPMHLLGELLSRWNPAVHPSQVTAASVSAAVAARESQLVGYAEITINININVLFTNCICICNSVNLYSIMVLEYFCYWNARKYCIDHITLLVCVCVILWTFT